LMDRNQLSATPDHLARHAVSPDPGQNRG
jgi:hypothetical protein